MVLHSLGHFSLDELFASSLLFDLTLDLLILLLDLGETWLASGRALAYITHLTLERFASITKSAERAVPRTAVVVSIKDTSHCRPTTSRTFGSISLLILSHMFFSYC